MSPQQIIALVMVAAVIFACFYLLWGIIRFSIISPRRTRGRQRRIRQPQLQEIEAKWKVSLPAELESIYRRDIVDRSEFYLVPAGTEVSRGWYIANFLPLTVIDVSEVVAATGVPGIPIAYDADRGTYYLPFEAMRAGKAPAVLLRKSGSKQDVEVASSAQQFFEYQPMDLPDKD